MEGPFDSRNPLVGLIDEVVRINGRLRGVFSASRREAGLGESAIMVLNAVVEAERPPTVSQIARSFGVARQLVQRAADGLEESGLIESQPNPDHKRAALLVATAEGTAAKRRADAEADRAAAALCEGMDLETVRAATRALRAARKQLEARLRAGSI